MDVFFGRSFQSWYKKKLSKKTSAVKKWLNEQKEKRPSNTGSEDDDSSSGVKKVGGVGGEVMGPKQPVSCDHIFNPRQRPLEGTPPQCGVNDLLNYLQSLPEHDLSNIIKNQGDSINTFLTNYFKPNTSRTPDKQYLGLNHIYESFNFFYKDNDEQDEKFGGSGSAARQNKINPSDYEKIRLYSDIKHDFKKSSHLPEKEFSLTEDSFFHFVISNKQTELITKLWYGDWDEMKKNFRDSGVLPPYSHVVLDMRLSNAITYSPDSFSDIKAKADFKRNYLQELRTYGNLLDPTMNMSMLLTGELYTDDTPIKYLNRLSAIMTNFFAVEFPGIKITVRNFQVFSKTFDITFVYNNKTHTIEDYNGSLVMISKIKKELTKCPDDTGNNPCKIKTIATTLSIPENKQELFVQMFKSFGDHVQLKEFHQIYDEQKQNTNHIVNKTIFGTRDRILIADGIYQDTPIIFKLSNKFNTDIQQISVTPTSSEGYEVSSMEDDDDKPVEGEDVFVDEREASSPQFLFVYTDKNMGEKTPVEKIIYNKCVYYYNQIHGNESQINDAYVINSTFRYRFVILLFSIVKNDYDVDKAEDYKTAMKGLYKLLYGSDVYLANDDYKLIQMVDLGFAILKQHVLLLKLHTDTQTISENKIIKLIDELDKKQIDIDSTRSERKKARDIETYDNQVEMLRTIGNTHFTNFEEFKQKCQKAFKESFIKIQNMGLNDGNIETLLNTISSVSTSIRTRTAYKLEKINNFKKIKVV
jgi:hypothetical protein